MISSSVAIGVSIVVAVWGFASDTAPTMIAPVAVAIDSVAIVLYIAFGMFSSVVIVTVRLLYVIAMFTRANPISGLFRVSVVADAMMATVMAIRGFRVYDAIIEPIRDPAVRAIIALTP